MAETDDIGFVRKQLNVEILETVKDKADADAKERGIPLKILIESILAAYYGMGDLYVEPKDIQKARQLLEAKGYKVTKEEVDELTVRTLLHHPKDE